MNIKNGESSINLYHTFYSSKSFEKQNKNYHDILKGTKSILRNFISFKNYIKNYKNKTEVTSFKAPNITKYPIINSKSLSLIPISKTPLYKKEEKQNNIKEFETINHCDETKNNIRLNFQNKLKTNLKILKQKYQKYINKKKEKENPIIAEFFYKWTNNESDDIKNPHLNNFSSLNYSEENIFYFNYKEFLREKIEKMKKDKITNLQENIESEFDDKKGRKIKIELNSIKIIFKSIPKNNENKASEQIIINLPLSFVFLFYINGFEFFKKIILSSIQFSNNFKLVSFNDKNIYLLIKKYFKHEKDFEKIFYNEKNENNKIQKKFSFLKKDTCNFNSKLKIKRSLTLNDKLINTKKRTIKPIYIKNNKKDKEDIKIKKIKIIHVNKEIERKEKENQLLKEGNNSKQFNYEKQKTYDEYEFLWETPFKTYKVLIQLPIIKLWCEHLKKTVVTFCEKNLFLYMFKNNFTNWDFYALHYLFSIKNFRKLILNKYRIKLKPLLLRNIIDNKIINHRTSEGNFYINDYNKLKDENNDSLLNFEAILYTRYKKVNYLMDKKKESLIFFYTDNFNINSIIEFNSYRILIDYDKLNPNKKWEFHLDFKQMLNLIKINKYEALETFLPKLIKTNFEYGNLEINFYLINKFDSNILNYKKNEIDDKIIDKKIKENLKIEIKNPYIIVEKFVEGIRFSNISNEIVLTEKVLNKFSIIENTTFWTKTILEIIEQKNKENEIDEGEELKSSKRI